MPLLGRGAPAGGPVGDRLPEIAAQALASTLDRQPVEATYLGDHARDALLPDPSAAAAAARVREVRALHAQLDALPLVNPAPTGSREDVDTDDAVDAAVLQTVLAAELLDLDEIREDEWNPMLHNPGGGLHALLSRDFAPLPDRLRSLTGRLAATPDYLAAARERLGTVSLIHLTTARDQLRGTLALLDDEIPRAVHAAGAAPAGLDDALRDARAALAGHDDWLAAQEPSADRDPRLGEPLFRAKLALTLDTAFEPQRLLARAEADLDRLTGEIEDAAGALGAASARAALDSLAGDTVDDATVLAACAGALAETTGFVRSRDLVAVPDDRIDVVAMPEIDRGVAIAYCRPNGPLEQRDIPTEIAVSPTPHDWPAERVASFYREYNRHMLHDLVAHEAMPGHALQLAHANRHGGRTPIRSVWWSGSFVEGWAVYAEQLMAEHGYRGDVSAHAAAAVRMQQLKMQLRSTINAILDIRFHCGDLDEAGALDLMQRRGFQELGEAAPKWRRVQLGSTQLCTYYVGYVEVAAVAADLRAAHPDWGDRQVHDAMLAHGSPPARHLRTLLGLTPHG